MAPSFWNAKIFPKRSCFEAGNSSSIYRAWPLYFEVRAVGPDNDQWDASPTFVVGGAVFAWEHDLRHDLG